MNSRLLLTLVAGAALALPAGAQMRQDQAVRTCQDNIRSRAVDQFGTDDLRFNQISSNRNGWISGTLLVGEGPNAEAHRFSCSVNMYNGYIRSARIQGAPEAYNNGYGGQRYGEAGRDMMAGSMDSCRSIVADKIQDQGYFDVRINSMNLDRDGDRISGSARAQGQDHPEGFSFSCQLDPNTGAVRATNLLRR